MRPAMFKGTKDRRRSVGGPDALAQSFRRVVMGLEPFVKDRCRVDVAAWDLDPHPFEPFSSLDEAGETLDAFADDVRGLDHGVRRADLEDDVRALRSLLRILRGEPLPYLQRVREWEQCPAEAPGEGELARLRSDVEEAAKHLGLRGDLGAAIREWERLDLIPVEEVEAYSRRTMEEARGSSAAVIGLPPGERVDLRMTHDQPWSGFSDYKGDMLSDVQVNLDVPWTYAGMRLLMTHEAYPGHHTDVAWKIHHYRQGRLAPDRAISFGGSPVGPISEGLAEFGVQAIGWNDARDHLSYTLSLYRFAMSLRTCIGVWEKGWGREEAMAQMMEEEYITEERATHAFDFFNHPLYGPHAFCYFYGTRAVEEAHRAAVEAGLGRQFLYLLYSRPFTLEGFRAALKSHLGLRLDPP